jgi:hypothetical protein
MEMRRLAEKRRGRTIGSLTAWYGLVSGYGERWGHALTSFIVVCLFWALLYLTFGLWIKTTTVEQGVSKPILIFAGFASAPPEVAQNAGNLLERFGHAMLHSFLAATVIGRDVYAQPVNAMGQAVQMIEIILGPLLFGLMALAIRRRFQR